MNRFFAVALLVALGGTLAFPTRAQDRLPAVGKTAGTQLQFSGLAYIDYAYMVATPIEELEGVNGFGYRRLYLTTDFVISDAFSGRARLEANDGSTTAQGRPAPFVKDLYLRWRRGQQQVFAGISSPPAFTVSEGFYGYRSLEKTILDRNSILSSRDFGVAARGHLTAEGTARYGLMVANNNSVRGENDKYKRVYGQLELYPTDALTFTFGGDYASYGDERDDGYTINAFGGYDAGRVRVGVEGFFNQIHLNDANEDGGEGDANLSGVSVFAVADLNPTVHAVLRFDHVERDLLGATSAEDFFLIGIDVQTHDQVHIIPNVVYSKENALDDPEVMARLTLHVDF